ncbi:hypothetical protein N9U43_00485 [Cytophagia bacterium]|nr:hypothetical protein [Cytophagia bacterium]
MLRLFTFSFLFLFLSLESYSQLLPSMIGSVTKKGSGVSSDTWDSSTKATCITLSNGNLTSLESNCGNAWNSVYGSTGVSSGITEWEITINAYNNVNDNAYDVMVGVATSRDNPNTHFQNGNVGYGYILQNGGIYHNGFSYYGASYGVGDVIKISLNSDTNQLTFYKNGVSQGVAYTVSEGTYYLAVSYCDNTNTRITITD